MKKLITSAFLMFVLVTANASNDVSQMNNLASDIARRMANQIELNESEYIQVKSFTLEKLTQVATIRDMYNNDFEMMVNKINEVENAYTHKIESLLNTKQFENYLALSKSFKTNIVTIAEVQE